MRRLALLVIACGAFWLAPGAFASGWCGGSDETAVDRADVVTGRQVHAIVAIPADGVDKFAADAARLADDLGSLETWWAGQDPSRDPRLDDADLAGGRCVDISFVRLLSPSSAYTGASAAFDLIQRELFAAGFTNAYKKYVVYYDGPSVETDVCGTGGGDFDAGPSFAVVWLAGCPDVPADSVAAHELLHALGALPAGAPNACAGDAGHPCDSASDILYPFSSGAPLAQLVLDVNHDDYYGHRPGWLDIRSSPWLHLLDVPPVGLTVAFSGAGTVSSDLPGVSCTATCTTQWDPGSQVMLAPDGTATSRFVRWTGGCSGNSICSVKLDGPVAVSAVFGPLRIPLRITAVGKGAVRCTPRCGKTFTAGNPLRLKAVAATGWRFSGWTGGCRGARPTCTPGTDFALSVRAVFRRR